ncbi:MAG: DbpA RNA-binding domain-containing protein [Methylococcaceae bacterium NSP1-2]|nr:MAG: DbpA RNA-binding domain-containing protein [Methylococcaceae bacterium NSP1-2]
MVDMTAFMSVAKHNDQEFMLDDLLEGKLLKNCLQQILIKENLASQRCSIKTIAAELSIDSLDCASALLYLLQSGKNTALMKQEINTPVLSVTSQPNIKMVRYRLDVGSKHQLSLDTLKQVLVEESGVDKNNIGNVKIQDLYTLIDLPDEMPLDIFQHLKSVEINQQKLDIRRVKARNKKRGNGYHRRGRQANSKSGNKISNQVSS